VLGGLRVTLLKDEIGIFHACLAQGFLALLVVIALVTSPFWAQLIEVRQLPQIHNIVRLAVATSAIIYLQLALGATMRHEHRDLAILDFPLAYGKLLPVLSTEELARINAWRDARALSDVAPFHIWLQMAHRIVALVIIAGIVAVSVNTRTSATAALSRLSQIWILLLCCQIALGAWTIWSNKAADVATAHVAVGATMLCLGVAISAIALRLKFSTDTDLSLAQPALAQERIHVS
jgi:cytochrome c oxidase assembly protein subunit 15